MKLFGSTIVPIHVPLAPGETKDQYEARFREWLARQGLSLEALERDADDNLERYYRFNFATENANGTVRFEPPESTPDNATKRCDARASPPGGKRLRSDRESSKASPTRSDRNTITRVDKKQRIERTDHSNGDTPHAKEYPRLKVDATRDPDSRPSTHTKAPEAESPTEPAPFRCSLSLPPRNASLPQVTRAYSSCGCRRCLTRGMQHLAMAVTNAEARQCTSCTHNQESPIDGPLTKDVNQRKETRGVTPPITENIPDMLEAQLVAAYGEINELVVMNEGALQTEVERLATKPIADIQTMARLHDENQELREMLQGEMERRNATLAVLVVYQWRHDPRALESMVDDPAAQHTTAIQNACHVECSRISTAESETRSYVAKLRRQVDSMAEETAEANNKRHANMKDRLLKMLQTAELKIEQLHAQRRQQFRLLIHFDKDLRLLIRWLLARAATIGPSK